MDRRAAQIIPGRMRLCLRFWDGELAGIRTQDPRLKMALITCCYNYLQDFVGRLNTAKYV